MDALIETLPELDSDAIAQRLRMHMGDKKLTRSKLALATGISRTSLGAKLDGDVPFTIEEVDAVATAIGRPWFWVLTGRDGSPDTSHPERRDTLRKKRRVSRTTRTNSITSWLPTYTSAA